MAQTRQLEYCRSRLATARIRKRWAYLADYEHRTGGEVLAIAHNGNLSNGQMFSSQNFARQLIHRKYAEQRSRWEPLYEVMQGKGSSETHPFLTPTDEFADFEAWNSWGGKRLPAGRNWDETERKIKEGEYARAALRRGLGLQAQLGVNPFKFGMIGSTDAHTSLSAAEENNFWGERPDAEPSGERWSQQAWKVDDMSVMNWQPRPATQPFGRRRIRAKLCLPR